MPASGETTIRPRTYLQRMQLHARAVAVNLLLNVAVPVAVVFALESRVGLLRALAISAIAPAADTAITFARQRQFDAIGTISLVFIALSVAGSLISGDVHFALAKESLLTATFGILCLGSLLARRPLIFYTARSFVAAGDAAAAAAWDARWAQPRFRSALRFMTLVWGLAFVGEAVARVVLVYSIPAQAAIVVSPVLAGVVFTGLMVWTIRDGKRRQQHADARAPAAASGL